jgi:hypothetical protein
VKGPGSLAIVAFASSEYANLSTDKTGKARDAALLSFAYDPPVQTLSDTGDVLLNENNLQSVFSLPFDGILENIYMNAGNYSTSFSSYEAYPYIQIFTALPDAKDDVAFTPLAGAVAIPLSGYSGTTASNTMTEANVTNLNIPLVAGTRILIGGMMRVDNTSAVRTYNFYFTGGLAFRSKV